MVIGIRWAAMLIGPLGIKQKNACKGLDLIAFPDWGGKVRGCIDQNRSVPLSMDSV